jgi:hypothetical protein
VPSSAKLAQARDSDPPARRTDERTMPQLNPDQKIRQPARREDQAVDTATAPRHRPDLPEGDTSREASDASESGQIPGLAWRDGGAGRVPLVLRIGVTGHRCLADPQAMAGVVAGVLRRIRDQFRPGPATPVVLVAVSALAEGADRLVTHVVLAEPGSRLEAVLPLPRTVYARGFGTAASRAEFRDLLTQASRVSQAPPAPSPEEAYEWAGQHVADNCDVLIAMWDGQPARGRGGTAQIVAYARQRGVPLVWIGVTDDQQTRFELDGARADALWDAARDLGKFNSGEITRAAFEFRLTEQLAQFGLGAGADDPAPRQLRPRCELAAGWLVPHLIRADVLALRLQRQFGALSTSLFAMAAAAVLVVAIQASFWPAQDWGAAVEVPLLLALLAVLLTGNRLRLHQRWISHRFLAERLRSAYFLALAGTGDRARRPDAQASFTDPAVTWVERALAEITAARPAATPGTADVGPLRGYLSSHWIGSQASYHTRAARQHEKRDRLLRRATATLFAITLLAATVHLLGPGQHIGRLAALLVTAAIAVPAIGGALHGIAAQRSHRHHSERYERTASLLRQLAARMDQAHDLREIQLIAADAERVMREENNDWFGVMRFHDIELIT